MTESSHNSVVLKSSNEERFNHIYTTFAKAQSNAMRFSQFMQFLLDRCLITNKTTVKKFYHLFLQATDKRIAKEPPPPANVVLEKVIKKEELIFLFNELGKFLYHGAKGQQDKIYNELLSEKIVADKETMHYSRVMILDQTNRKMFLQNSVKTCSSFEDELKNIYLIYIDENYEAYKRQGRLLLSHRQVELQNKKMSALYFIRFLKEAQILPHLINIEQVEEILSRVVPPVIPKQNEFYYKHFLVDAYSKDLNDPELKHSGDPGLILFEFMIVLSRIAIETSREVENSKKVYEYIIGKFFKGYLNIRTNEQISDNIQLPNINRQFIHKLENYYKNTGENSLYQPQKSEEQEKNYFNILKEKQHEMNGFEKMQIDIDGIMKVLDAELPQMPQQIEVQKQLPPPYPKKFKDVQKVIIGQQPPAQKADKNKSVKPPAKKKANLKKGQKPPRVFQFNDEKQQTKKVLGSQDYFQKLATQLDYSLKPLSSFDRGCIPLDPFPTLIAEILYPNEIPQQVLPYIQAGLNAHNQGSYALAFQNYSKAYDLWREEQGKTQLSPNLEQFFEFTRGSVYQSAGKDDYAFNSFYVCKKISQKIAYLNPDRALPYCGMGQVLYNAQQYQLSARCFLKARQIREKLLGVQSVDTATVFNNLGCCFFMEDRNKQALSYFKIALTIFKSELGDFHERSQTAKENEDLCNRGFYENTPEYKKLWEVYQRDPFGKKKKKKKKKK